MFGDIKGLVNPPSRSSQNRILAFFMPKKLSSFFSPMKYIYFVQSSGVLPPLSKVNIQLGLLRSLKVFNPGGREESFFLPELSSRL